MVPAMDAAELLLKMILCWKNQAISKKDAKTDNKLLMEKINNLRAKIKVDKLEIILLTVMKLSGSGK